MSGFIIQLIVKMFNIFCVHPKCGDEKYVKTPANAGIFIKFF